MRWSRAGCLEKLLILPGTLAGLVVLAALALGGSDSGGDGGDSSSDRRKRAADQQQPYRPCPNCGQMTPANQPFCMRCGQRL